MTTKKERARQRTRAVSAYLRAIDLGQTNGSRAIALGQLEGFPTWSADPAVVREAADAVAATVPDISSPTRRLLLIQRVLDLRAAADALEEADPAAALRAAFVETAAAWAEERGVSYAAFREYGVPADVLKEAGISRAQ